MLPNHTLPASVSREARNDPLGALRHLMAANDGLFHLAQARALGVAERNLRTMLRRGEIVAVHPGVYRAAAAPQGFRSRLRTGLLATGDGVVSHGSAAELLELPATPKGRPELTVKRSAVRPIDGVKLHRTRSLDPIDRTAVQGLACTMPARTIIDLAGRLDAPRLLHVVDEAIWSRRCTRESLHDRATTLGSGRSNTRAIVQVTAPGAEPDFRSALERNFAQLISRGGLPRPEFNVPVRVQGRLFVVDALWHAARVIVELHGLRFHDTPDAVDRDANRQNMLIAEGFTVLAFTWRRVHEEPETVLRQVRHNLN